MVLVLLFAGFVTASISYAEIYEAEDIKPFGLIDVDGYLRLGYLLDDRSRTSAGTAAFEDRLTWEQEVFVTAKTFVYHPGFLNMELGGGPLFVQQEFDSSDGAFKEDDTKLNLLARLNVLELKTYPVSLYFERTHPSISTSLSTRFITENELSGVSGRISDLFSERTSMRYTIERRTAEGGSSGWIVDDEIDAKGFQIETSYRESDRLAFVYDRFDADSRSGSPGLPISPSKRFYELGQLSARNRFWKDNRLQVFQTLRRLQQVTESASTIARDDTSYLADVTLRMQANSRAFFRYRQGNVTQTEFDSELKNFEIGYVPKSFGGLLMDISGEFNSVAQGDFSRDVSALRGAASFSKALGIGVFGVSGRIRAARTDQESGSSGIQVIGEVVVLDGTTPVDLENEFVVSGSVVVSNSNRTQIFVEGLDYRLIIVGSATSVQRLIDGNINDGETVLVDYTFESTGTSEFDTLNSGITVNFGFLNTMNAYVRFDDQDTKLRSGEFTNPINDRRSLELGVSMSGQFLDGWVLNGELRHRDQEEEISPYTSDTLNIGISRQVLGSWRISLAGALSVVDFENSTEDVDYRSYNLGVSGRVFRSVQLNYSALYLDDKGGSLPRKQLQHILRMTWAYRQMRFSLWARYLDYEQGTTTKTDQQVTAQLTRVF
jgi:hypothetical protein